MTTGYHIEPIGIIHSPFQEKFAIPRQPGLATAAKGEIELLGDANQLDCVRGIEQYSHLWLSFIFHGTAEHGWQPLVRPPRLGGNKKMGVFATRSTFRPNALGLSVVKLEGVSYHNKQVRLHISGLDLLNGTPIVDIKPYIQFADAIVDAQSGFAQQTPALLKVNFSQQASAQLASYAEALPHLALLIEQVVAQDPRPAYKKAKQDEKIYGMALYHINIKWQLIDEHTALILTLSEK